MIDGSVSEGVSWVLKQVKHAQQIHMLSRILCLLISQLLMNEKKKKISCHVFNWGVKTKNKPSDI